MSDVWRTEFKKRLKQRLVAAWGSVNAASTKLARAGIKRSPLNRWVQDNREELPRADHLKIICEQGGISAEYLLFGKTGLEGQTAEKGEASEEWVARRRRELSRRLHEFYAVVLVERYKK